MKTAIIFQEIPENDRLFVVDGDYSHLNDVYINSTDSHQDKQDELSDLIYDKDNDWWKYRHKQLSIFEIRDAVRDGAELILCGFFL